MQYNYFMVFVIKMSLCYDLTGILLPAMISLKRARVFLYFVPFIFKILIALISFYTSIYDPISLFFLLNVEINRKDRFCFTNFAVRNIIFMHKAGFVNIVGKPNAGKSTLLNQLMGEKLAIVTQKAQTTRHRIFGIYNEEDLQIVFSDTPGVLDPKYGLQEKMMDFVKDSLQDADVFLFIVDVTDKAEPSEFLIDKLNKIPVPVLLLLNKVDQTDQAGLEKLVEDWHNRIPKAEILPISALNAFNTEIILPKIKSLLPESPPYYDKDQFTDKPERFFVNEAIREKILLNYDKEIPYSVEVVTEQFKEKEGIIFIDSIIYVERDTQKGIIIGHKGEAIKKVGTDARLDLEKFFSKKIHLNLFVKVKKDWRKNDRDLKNFGYR